MKTFFVAAALALTTMSATANKTAAKDKINSKVTVALQNEFGNVDNITWSNASNNMLRATFTKDDETVSAFFDQKGEFIASTIEISKDALPAKLKAAINKKVKEGVITEALQMQTNEEFAYYVKVYANGSEKVYKGTSAGLLAEVSY